MYMKKATHWLAGILAVLCTALFTGVAVESARLPDEYQVVAGNSLTFAQDALMDVRYLGTEASGQVIGEQQAAEYMVGLDLLSCIPVKTAAVKVSDALWVEPLGQAFGMKIYTAGVMVVGMEAVETRDGSVNPGQTAGLQIGDMITRLNGTAVSTSEAVAAVVQSSDGTAITVEGTRNGEPFTLSITPAKSKEDGKYKAGLWVRDSSAGIGTLTFYSPSNGILAGLGHGVNDVDAAELLPVEHGQMVATEVTGVTKSISGSPGELKGVLLSQILGSLLLNSNTGVYGLSETQLETDHLVEIAMKQEVCTGDAQILCTVAGETPQTYECKIERVNYDEENLTQNLVIRVTDENLLSITGGIVQGMSGSPILQNGKLVGAVTHVFVGNPAKGYGIFAETMYNTSNYLLDTLA